MSEGLARKEGYYWAVLAAIMAVSAVLAMLLGQDRGFDLLNYHYYSGFALLHKSFGYDFAPAQIQTFHNPLMHIFSYVTLAHLSAKSAAAVTGAIQGVNFYLVFRIAQIVFSGWRKSLRYILGLACAGAGFYGITSRTELGATYGDNMISILVLAGLLLVLSRLPQGATGDKRMASFTAAGLLVGAAFGLKFTSAIYLLGMLFAVPLTLLKSRDWKRPTMAVACGSAIGFLVTYGFWSVHLFLSYRNPFFPYLNKIFQSPFFEPSNFFDDRFFPRNWLQALFYPFFLTAKNSYVSEVEFRDLRLALCYIAMVALFAAILARSIRRKPTANSASSDLCMVFLALFFTVSYVSWVRLYSIYRYLSVLELLAPVFLALVIRRFFKKDVVVLSSTIALMCLVVASAVPIDFGRMEFDNDILKLRLPRIQELDQSVVLMAGYEPISYIVPSFPDKTRFVRISSTFSIPGRNRFVDAHIERIIAGYDQRHRFAYVANVQEIGQTRLDASAYGTTIDANSCFEIRSSNRRQNHGYLCGVAGEVVRTDEKPVPEIRYIPKFVDVGGARLSGSSSGKFFNARIEGVRAGFLDILYEFDGEVMPVIRRWGLENSSLIHLGPFSRNGQYRIIGIRDSGAPEPDSWIPADIQFRINVR